MLFNPENQNCLIAKNYIIKFITQACSYGEFLILSFTRITPTQHHSSISWQKTNSVVWSYVICQQVNKGLKEGDSFFLMFIIKFMPLVIVFQKWKASVMTYGITAYLKYVGIHTGSFKQASSWDYTLTPFWLMTVTKATDSLWPSASSVLSEVQFDPWKLRGMNHIL